jgi:hypothetical protein
MICKKQSALKDTYKFIVSLIWNKKLKHYLVRLFLGLNLLWRIKKKRVLNSLGLLRLYYRIIISSSRYNSSFKIHWEE